MGNTKNLTFYQSNVGFSNSQFDQFEIAYVLYNDLYHFLWILIHLNFCQDTVYIIIVTVMAIPARLLFVILLIPLNLTITKAASNISKFDRFVHIVFLFFFIFVYTHFRMTHMSDCSSTNYALKYSKSNSLTLI